MSLYCCVLCQTQIANTNPEGMRVILEEKMTLLSVVHHPTSESMLILKQCLSETEFQKLRDSAAQFLKETKQPLATIAHDRYGQSSVLSFNNQPYFGVDGSVPIGNVLEVIARKEDEGKVFGFLRTCANELVRVDDRHVNSTINLEKAFDSALYISLELEKYWVMKPSANGIDAFEYEFPVGGKDKQSLMERIALILLNNTGYRTIVIDNIVGAGEGGEKVEVANPYEWIHKIHSNIHICDKWIIIGMIMDSEYPYEGCSPRMLQGMVNYRMEYEYVKLINFARGPDVWEPYQ